LANFELNELQQEFLRRFFANTNCFFLSLGAALVGYYLHHRHTQDLDLFTLESEIEKGAAIVNQVARELGADLEPLQTSPDFRRFLLRHGGEAIVVDLVREYVFQVDSEKRDIEGVRVDSPEEILANKLWALLSRSEVRDLVDVRALELAGFSLEDALEAAQKKDSGLTSAQLAWVLSEMRFGDDLVPPVDISVAELRNYLDDLKTRLATMAFPKKLI